ncbi:vasopressin receptor [Mactra antiquata]
MNSATMENGTDTASGIIKNGGLPNNESIINNTSDSNNTDPFIFLNWEPFDQAAAVISFILFFVIIILNGLVIYILGFTTRQKSRLFYFVLNLAISDILVGVLNVLGDGIQSAMYGEWHGGDILCRLWRFSKIVVLIASNNILVGMSVDRFLAIKYPLNTVRIGAWRYLNKTLVFSAWLISILVSCIFLEYTKGVNADPNGTTFMEQKGGCDVAFPQEWWQPYLTIVAVVVYILPTLVISICYIGICIVIWRKWRAGLKLSEISKDTSYDKLQERKTSKAGLLPKAKIKSIKMTVIICIAFFVCWTPYFVMMMLSVYQYPHLDPRYVMLFGMLYPLNSACNPIIFICFNIKLFWRRKQDGASVTSYDGVSTMNSTA